MSQAAIDGLATTVLEVQRDLNRWKALAEERKRQLNEAMDSLASAIDILNSWARETGTPEAEKPEQLPQLAENLWAKVSSSVHGLQLMNGKLLADSERLDWLMTTKRLHPQYETREGIDAARSGK